MDRNRTIPQILEKLMDRSRCRVQMAALLLNKEGRIISKGWNHEGPDGFGECAEVHCLKRADPDRVITSVMWIAGRRRKSGNPVLAKPCAACHPLVRQCLVVYYRTKAGAWEPLLP